MQSSLNDRSCVKRVDCKDKLFVPLLAQIYQNETYFPLHFIDLEIIWLAQRYTIITCSSLL